MGPLAALEALETLHQERSPRLVHAHAHPDVFSFLVEVLISFVNPALSKGLLDDGFFNSLGEFVKGVLRLQTAGEA